MWIELSVQMSKIFYCCKQSLKWLLHPIHPSTHPPRNMVFITNKQYLKPHFCFSSLPRPILFRNKSFLQPNSEFFPTYGTNLIKKLKNWPPLNFFNANSNLNFVNQAIFGLFILIFNYTYDCIIHTNCVSFTQLNFFFHIT